MILVILINCEKMKCYVPFQENPEILHFKFSSVLFKNSVLIFLNSTTYKLTKPRSSASYANTILTTYRYNKFPISELDKLHPDGLDVV